MSDAPATTDAEGLLNISKDGKAPPSRLGGYKDAAAIVAHLVKEDAPDRADRMDEQALLDGQPPFFQEDLDEHGQGNRANDNWGGAAAKSEQAKTPYHELLNGFQVELGPGVKGAERNDYSAIVAEGFNKLLTRFWPGFRFQFNQLVRQSVDFGVSVANHEHATDWRFRAGGLGEHLFPRPMQAYEDAANLHVVLREYRPDELYRWLTAPGARGIGFNLDEIKSAMLACDQGKRSWNEFEDGATNNLFGVTYSRRATVQLFRMRVVELTADGDEKVSECIGRADGQGKDFIFKSKPPQWIDAMRDGFTLFTAGIGNGDLHSIRGLAHKIFATSQTENQAINQMVDYFRFKMSVWMRPKDANSRQAIQSQPMQLGGITFIPPDAEFIEQNFPNLSDAALPFIQFMGAHREGVTGLYAASMSPSAVEQTREEIVQRTMQNGVLTTGAINWFYQSVENMVNSMRRRLCNPGYSKSEPGYRERQMFLDYCTSRGVPKAVVLGMEYVTPNRAVGGGSAGVALLLLKEAFNTIMPRLDPVGQQAFTQMYGERLLGADAMKTVQPSLSIVRTTQAQINAMDENRWLEDGKPVPTLPDDDNFLHAQTHDAALPDMANKVASGELPPAAYLAFLTAFIPHQGAHLAALEGDKRAAQFNKNLNVARQNQQHLTAKAQAEQNRLAAQAQAQQAKEGQQVSGLDPDLARHAAKTQAEVQAIEAKTAATAQGMVAIAQTKAEIAAQKATQRSAIEDAKNAKDILNDAPPPVSPQSQPTAPVPIP